MEQLSIKNHFLQREDVWGTVTSDMEKSISAITQAQGIVENANRYGQDKWVSWLPIVVDHHMYVAGSDWPSTLLGPTMCARGGGDW
jgi:hypothetical protein